MTAQKIYKKVGRRYVEIGDFDNEYLHFPHAAHLAWNALARLDLMLRGGA